jgi:hypothetical protein
MERGGPPETPGARAVRELLGGLEAALLERQALLRGPDTAGAREDAEALRLLIEDYLALLAARVPDRLPRDVERAA